ncbi:hypothetical protein HDU99_006349, partial [Rhizoclosmatium hyalinum]
MQEESRIDTVSSAPVKRTSADSLGPNLSEGKLSSASLPPTVTGGVLTELPVGVFLILTD